QARHRDADSTQKLLRLFSRLLSLPGPFKEWQPQGWQQADRQPQSAVRTHRLLLLPGQRKTTEPKMTAVAQSRLLIPPTFVNYRFDMAYDEMFEAQTLPREHYQALQRTLLGLAPEELRKSQQAADLTFLHEGITFTVYGSKEGTERIFPNDLLPRIIPANEWAQIEKGLTQRLTALNLFLRDIYHEGRILAEGIVPRELIYSCRHFRR